MALKTPYTYALYVYKSIQGYFEKSIDILCTIKYLEKIQKVVTKIALTSDKIYVFLYPYFDEVSCEPFK